MHSGAKSIYIYFYIYIGELFAYSFVSVGVGHPALTVATCRGVEIENQLIESSNLLNNTAVFTIKSKGNR